MATRVFRALFQEPGGSLEEIGVSKGGFTNERSIQDMIGNNIKVVFPGYEHVKQEFALRSNRIDTVAFNAKTKSFMFIEYKKGKSADVVNQAMEYLGTVNENRGEFLHQYGHVSGKLYKKNDIAWNKNKAVVISPYFTKRDCSTVKASKYTIELHRITKYEGGVMLLDRIDDQEVDRIDDQEVDSKIMPENVTPGEEEHLKRASGTTRGLYTSLKSGVEGVVPGLYAEPKKVDVKMLNKNGKKICVIKVQQRSLRLYYSTNKLKITRKDRGFVKEVGSDKYVSKIEREEDVARAIRYIRQVYKNEKGSTYSEGGHLSAKGSGKTRALYKELKGVLIARIPEAKSKATKRYISWHSPKAHKSFCTVEVLKKSLNLVYNTKRLSVPEADAGFVEHVRKNSVAGLGEYRSKINSKNDITRAIPYVMNVHEESAG